MGGFDQRGGGPGGPGMRQGGGGGGQQGYAQGQMPGGMMAPPPGVGGGDDRWKQRGPQAGGPGQQGMMGGQRGPGGPQQGMQQNRGRGGNQQQQQQEADRWARGQALPPALGGAAGANAAMMMRKSSLHKAESRYIIGQVVSDDPEEARKQREFKSLLNKVRGEGAVPFFCSKKTTTEGATEAFFFRFSFPNALSPSSSSFPIDKST